MGEVAFDLPHLITLDVHIGERRRVFNVPLRLNEARMPGRGVAVVRSLTGGIDSLIFA
jgi:hypothetical protein